MTGPVICAKATACPAAQDGECPFAIVNRWINAEYLPCPATGKPVEWKKEQ